MPIEIDISVSAGDWHQADAIEGWISSATSAALSHLGVEAVDTELSVLLTDDATMQSLNNDWRNKDKPTNVLSFPAFEIEPGESPGPMMGDVVLALETITREATLEDKSFEHHFKHLVVHGVLHLLGYDHENDTQAEQMEQLETIILEKLGVSDPYAVEEIDV